MYSSLYQILFRLLHLCSLKQLQQTPHYEPLVIIMPATEMTSHCESTQSSDRSEEAGGGVRGHWGNQFEFLLACMGYAIGLGNLWRFPYLCFENGGGAFLIPYAISLLFVGLPVFYLELCVGQYSSLGPNVAYSSMAPMFKGLGWSMVMLAFIVAVYYNMILAWILYYLGLVFYEACSSWDVPWRQCDNEYNTAMCWSKNLNDECFEENNKHFFWNKTCRARDSVTIDHTFFNPSDFNATKLFEFCNTTLAPVIGDMFVKCGAGNITFTNNQTTDNLLTEASFDVDTHFKDWSFFNNILTNTKLHDSFKATAQEQLRSFRSSSALLAPSDEMFNNRMYNLLATDHDKLSLGSVQWQLVLCNGVAWLLNCLALLWGVKSMGKIVYFTTLFPFAMLICLAIRGLTLGEGVGDGLIFYLKPDMTKLAEFKTWKDAMSQICYSLGSGFGTLITLASYNQFRTNVLQHSVIVGFINCSTSLIGGLAVFSTLGFLAKRTGKSVKDVVKNGHSLTFVAFPEAITQMGAAAPAVAFLFFLMLFTLGIDSEFAFIETVTTCICDSFPWLETKKKLVVVACCVTMFVLALPMCCERGINIFRLFDNYSCMWCLILGMFVETAVVIVIYGMPRFLSDIQHMMPEQRTWPLAKVFGPTGWYFRLAWTVSVPIIISVLLIGGSLGFERIKDVDGKTVLSDYVEMGGWFLALLPLWTLLIMALWQIIRCYRLKQPYEEILKPAEHWGTARHRAHLAQAQRKAENDAKKAIRKS